MTELNWHKSSYSGSQANCVEVASLPHAVALRDSKNPDGPKLAFAPEMWRTFTSRVKIGRTD
jgi:hypothetical protein